LGLHVKLRGEQRTTNALENDERAGDDGFDTRFSIDQAHAVQTPRYCKPTTLTQTYRKKQYIAASFVAFGGEMMPWFQNARLHINCFVTPSELKLTQKDRRTYNNSQSLSFSTRRRKERTKPTKQYAC